MLYFLPILFISRIIQTVVDQLEHVINGGNEKERQYQLIIYSTGRNPSDTYKIQH